MSNILKINCKQIYKYGLYMGVQATTLKALIEDMKNINEEIKKAWNGKDYESFSNNFEEYLTSIYEIVNKLRTKEETFKMVAIKHDDIDNALVDNMKRRRNNEQYYV